MGWRPVKRRGDDLVAWDEAKTIEGSYRGGEERTTQFGVNIIHFIEGIEGHLLSFFGTTQLNEDLATVPDGTTVRIEFTGRTRKTQKGFRVKEFIVYVAADDEPPSPAPPPVPAAETPEKDVPF
jgi:hypothetical protein